MDELLFRCPGRGVEDPEPAEAGDLAAPVAVAEDAAPPRLGTSVPPVRMLAFSSAMDEAPSFSPEEDMAAGRVVEGGVD